MLTMLIYSLSYLDFIDLFFNMPFQGLAILFLLGSTEITELFFFMCLWRYRYTLMLLFRNFIFVCVFTSAVLSNYSEFSLFVFRSCPYLGEQIWQYPISSSYNNNYPLHSLLLNKNKAPLHISQSLLKGSVDNIGTASQKLLESTFLFFDTSSHYLNTD